MMPTPVRASQLRVLIVTSRDSGGGAPRAIYRLFRALRDHSQEADVYLRVVHKSFDDPHIIGGKPRRSGTERLEYLMRTRFRKYFPREPFISQNKLLHSQALYDTGLAREINLMKPDVVLLGWLGNSTLSIREIGKIGAPVVWRLSDMWLFSGAEHYTESDRYSVGYTRSSRPRTESGPDINRETFVRKKRNWTKPQRIISPSHWMAGQSRRSMLTKHWPVDVIPNVIDTNYWKPMNKQSARKLLGIPNSSKLVLFGAGSGLKDFHKGGDLFLEALHILSRRQGVKEPEVIAGIFGEDGESYQIGRVQVKFFGRLDDEGLRQAYSSASVMVVPSRLDNFPSTAVEAQACGCPVVGFRAGGLPDVVPSGESGILCEPFDVVDLADAMFTILNNTAVARRMGATARARATTLWSAPAIAAQYFEVLASHSATQKTSKSGLNLRSATIHRAP